MGDLTIEGVWLQIGNNTIWPFAHKVQHVTWENLLDGFFEHRNEICIKGPSQAPRHFSYS